MDSRFSFNLTHFTFVIMDNPPLNLIHSGRQNIMTSPPSKHFDYVWHFSFHRVFQMIPPTTPLEHFAHSASLCNCYATWYPNRTIYSPDLLEVQNRELGICLLLKGTRRMASASSLLKLCRIKPLSHRLVSGSMMSATIKSLSTL